MLFFKIALLIPTENSHLRFSLNQPTTPAYNPLSKYSKSSINSQAFFCGKPQTAGVGCSFLSSSKISTPSLSIAFIEFEGVEYFEVFLSVVLGYRKFFRKSLPNCLVRSLIHYYARLCLFDY